MGFAVLFAFAVDGPAWTRVVAGLFGGWFIFVAIEANAANKKAAVDEARRAEEEARQAWDDYRAATLAFQEHVRRIIMKHASTLQRKRLMLVRVDDYGNTFTDAWDREKEYFLANVIAPDGSAASWKQEHLAFTMDAIEVGAQKPQDATAAVDVATMDPYVYEHYCAALLKEAGWETRVTQASGDQGIDVIASKDNKVLVVQAKRYANSVGNAAVQQIFAGKQYMGADFAAVVSPAAFTRSAMELARTTGVMLLHHDELKTL